MCSVIATLPGIEEIEAEGKTVLLRVDFNPPVGPEGMIADHLRIRAALPSIRALVERQARVLVLSHLGRPHGKVVEALRLAPIAPLLEGHLGQPVHVASDCVGDGVRGQVSEMRPGEVLLLENLRFHDGEERNDEAFASALASLGHSYVNDAFASSHRAHASIVGLPQLLPAAAGVTFLREVQVLGTLLGAPEHPYVAVLGGGKAADKLPLVSSLLPRVDQLLVGGALAQALRLQWADSTPFAGNGTLRLPVDVVAVPSLDRLDERAVFPAGQEPPGYVVVDIGPETAQSYASIIASAATVFWNGPMGVFERECFAAGTQAVCHAIAACLGMTVAGGGETIAALSRFECEGAVSHGSIGGGATLEFLSGKTLPGIAALRAASRTG